MREREMCWKERVTEIKKVCGLELKSGRGERERQIDRERERRLEEGKWEGKREKEREREVKKYGKKIKPGQTKINYILDIFATNLKRFN